MLKKILILCVAVALFLALPLIVKDRSRAPLVGPRLAELKYTEVSFDNQSAGIQLSGLLFLPETNTVSEAYLNDLVEFIRGIEQSAL